MTITSKPVSRLLANLTAKETPQLATRATREDYAITISLLTSTSGEPTKRKKCTSEIAND